VGACYRISIKETGMRCQLLIADGNRQILLYPEDEDERTILKCLTSKGYDITINMTNTEINICRAGWYRNSGGDRIGVDGDQAVITLMKKKARGIECQ